MKFSPIQILDRTIRSNAFIFLVLLFSISGVVIEWKYPGSELSLRMVSIAIVAVFVIFLIVAFLEFHQAIKVIRQNGQKGNKESKNSVSV